MTQQPLTQIELDTLETMLENAQHALAVGVRDDVWDVAKAYDVTRDMWGLFYDQRNYRNAAIATQSYVSGDVARNQAIREARRIIREQHGE